MQKNARFKKYIRSGAIFFLSVFFIFTAGTAQAADPKLTIRDDSYSAKYVSQSIPDPIEIEAGETKWVKINFKNTGTATWKNEGNNYISAYTMEERERASIFYTPAGWKSPKQIGRMVGTVKPGEVGEYGVPLKAPETIGTYKEEFYLAAENWTWVDGGYFFLEIKVVPSSGGNSEVGVVGQGNKEIVVDSVVSEYKKATYKVNRLLQSKRSVTASGNERVKITLGWQNTGGETWSGYEILADTPVVFLQGAEDESLHDSSWQSESLITSYSEAVGAGEMFREDFYFRTPRVKGNYEAKFYLTADNQKVDEIIIPIVVTQDAPRGDSEEIVIVKPWLDYEPRIRVGLWQNDGLISFGSTEDDYNVFAGTEKMGVLAKNDMASLNYLNGIYHFAGSDLDFKTREYIRLEPKSNPHAVFELVNYTRTVSWKGSGNYNKYRGAMEYRIGEVNPDLWVINDLLFEDYMKGVAENSNGSPSEYLRAQSVAQRSYAYSIVQSDKYGVFDVVATTGDQLYLGYNSEAQMSNFLSAVEATRGYMATYDNAVVITPYYAHSNGWTKSWTSVWGGANKPWLVPVQCEYDNGRSQLGHGVGMSQLDASARAQAKNLAWQELVQYYYTGVGIDKIYE